VVQRRTRDDFRFRGQVSGFAKPQSIDAFADVDNEQMTGRVEDDSAWMLEAVRNGVRVPSFRNDEGMLGGDCPN